ncbi:ribosome assembly RNA-binding protein YhbY [Schnuerera sp. xch1]|uniref:ribosome assembly RNA-binding protein YhbY n=1 Tax=Schnuerera sp. xch1 TaxID=2874283 RepID=UPI001CBE8DE0|nr:ribosome assembly RNA-binding protein YhbY [Schnuerera sp. xch1]MBZ2175357.1 ribosome assembly RNA-binding protein YhbY [Schnuerera sp. xch1]
MLTGKQRSFLKGIANNLDPIFQVGKNGITENFIKQVDQALEAREIIKIKVLNNSLLDAKEVASELAKVTSSEFVQSIGNKLVLYRKSKESKKIVLP